MKKLFLIVFVAVNLIASDFINVPLNEYIATVSRVNNINIVLDENIDHKITVYVSKHLNKKNYFDVLETLLQNKNMYLEKNDNYYMIKKVIKEDEKNTPPEKLYYQIKLNYIDFKDIENFLKVYEKNINYQFIDSSKVLLVKATKKDFESIKKVISMVDNLPKQLKLKVTIVDTNLDKLKEFGIEHQTELNNEDTNFFYNLIAYPFTISNNIPNTTNNRFYTFLKLMNNSGNSKLISSPILTLSDNKSVSFDVATNIPYKTGETTLNDDTAKTTSSIQYKDVGLKIKAVPRIYNENIVYLDLELEVSNIISSTDNIPIVSKKYIKQSFYLKSNNIFVLTGINQSETKENTSGIPYLMDIPVLGWLFKYDTKNDTSNNLSIFFEIIGTPTVNDQIGLKLKNEFEKVVSVKKD